MRIIGGSLKKKKIFSVKGTTTRPTSDKLRETIFNIISSKIENAFVLDLFAGTGAMGIEALSRGATEAVFIENNYNALATIKKNISCCSLEKQSTIFRHNILKNLNCLIPYQNKIDLVFIDPPYCNNTITDTLINLNNSHAVKLNTTVIIEHAKSEKVPENIANFILEDQRKYGITVISFFIYNVRAHKKITCTS